LTQPLAVLTGASAGAVESLVVVPFELVKIRLQDKTSASRYSGLLDCLTKVIRHEGPLALYNGFEATLWRHIVWNAGYFGCIFQVRAQLPRPETSSNPKMQKMGNDLAAGFVGGVVGTTFNVSANSFLLLLARILVSTVEMTSEALFHSCLARILLTS
jgi:solute carrier family 25 2-oxodicarboxylate transporter 21